MGRPLRIVTALLPLMAGLLLLVAGCGGATDGDGDARLSKREYIEQVDQLQRDAADVVSGIDDRRFPASPAEAKAPLAALDELIAGHEALRPPRDWADEHTTMVGSLTQMRDAIAVVSRASARNRKAVEHQVGRYRAAAASYAEAVEAINASR